MDDNIIYFDKIFWGLDCVIRRKCTKSNNFALFSVKQRLQGKIIKIVDVSYGGENGFNQAIELSSDSLANVKFIQEKKLIGNE